MVMRALRFQLMTHLNFALAHNCPSESQGLQAPIVGTADYLRLRQYVLSDKLVVPEDVVRMYARCTYVDQRIGTQREIELVYPDESDPAMGKISVLTPVGSALIGLRVGQEIAWEFPDGSMRCLKVASVTQRAR